MLVQSWDSAVLGQYSLGTLILGQWSWEWSCDSGLGTVVLGHWSRDSGLGIVVLGQWSWDSGLGTQSWDTSLGTVVLGQ